MLSTSSVQLVFNPHLKTILSNPEIPYIRTELDNGYYDQPYFINEFKFFTHQSPTQYLSHDLSRSDLNLVYYNSRQVYNCSDSSSMA